MKNEAGFAGQTLSTDVGAYRFSEDSEVGDDLYFVRSADGFCKIGRSNNISNRLKTLRNGNPHRLTLLLSLPGHGWQERVWHAAFAHHRAAGEWFDWSAGLAEAIEAARVGDEWIATLASPYPPEALRLSGWAFQVPMLDDKSPGSVADFLWRNHIADLEEDAAEGILPTPESEIARLGGGAPSHPNPARRLPLASAPASIANVSGGNHGME